MGITPEQSSGFADADADVRHPSEPATGDRLTVRTDTPSGVRSSTRSWSVPTGLTRPGPTRSAITKLASDVEYDPDVVDQFVSDYLGLLDHRMNRLRALLTDVNACGADSGDRNACGGDAGDAVTVLILSLETTSAMLGGDDVAAAARDLRLAVVAQRPTGPAFEELLGATRVLRGLLTASNLERGADLRPPAPDPADG